MGLSSDANLKCLNLNILLNLENEFYIDKCNIQNNSGEPALEIGCGVG